MLRRRHHREVLPQFRNLTDQLLHCYYLNGESLGRHINHYPSSMASKVDKFSRRTVTASDFIFGPLNISSTEGIGGVCLRLDRSKISF